jgi:hypothetical protein
MRRRRRHRDHAEGMQPQSRAAHLGIQVNGSAPRRRCKGIVAPPSGCNSILTVSQGALRDPGLRGGTASRLACRDPASFIPHPSSPSGRHCSLPEPFRDSTQRKGPTILAQWAVSRTPVLPRRHSHAGDGPLVQARVVKTTLTHRVCELPRVPRRPRRIAERRSMPD